MLENRVKVDGSAYLAKTLFTDIRPIRRKSAYLFQSLCLNDYFYLGFLRPAVYRKTAMKL